MKKIFLALILVMAFILRVYNLSDNPPGFFCDEASIGYNAYTILKSGKDEYGTRLPLFFKAFGEYKSPILIYSVVPFVALFGLNEFAVRLPSAIYGTLTILAIFLLAREFFNEQVGLLAAFLLAISPWHVHLSRTSLEGLSPFVLLATIGSYFFLRGLNKNYLLLLSFFCLGLSLYTYAPARIFIPFFLFGLLFIYRKNLLAQKKSSFFAIFLFVVLALPLGWHLYQGEGFARWNQVSVFNDNSDTIKKGVYIIWMYLAHFSSDFLFRSGDIDFPSQSFLRHSVHGLGQFYWFQLFFLIVGLGTIFGANKSKQRAILTLWLLLYPLGTTLTVALGPQATRSIIGVIPFQIITACGVVAIFNMIKVIRHKNHHRYLSIAILVAVTIVIFLSFVDFSIKLFYEYPLYAAGRMGWQYGPKEVIEYFVHVENQYDEFFMGGDFDSPQIFLKFYAPDHCIKCQIGGLERLYPSKRQLFALPPYKIPKDLGFDYKVQKQIYYPNGEVAFKIFEVNKPEKTWSRIN